MEELLALAADAPQRTLSAGELLVADGEPAGPLFVLLDGELQVRKSGVTIAVVTDPGACVAFLGDALRRLSAAEPLASVAVLAPSRAASAVYHEGLERGEVPRLRRAEGGRFSFAPGVEVAEIEHARGLEFDYAVLVDVSPSSFPDTPAGRRLLHVGSTRAIHQLWLTHAGPASPLLDQALRSAPGGSPVP